MILKRDILQILANLETEYNSAGVTQQTQFSKLAVLELCGWLEESFDTIAKRCLQSKIRTTPFTDIFNQVIIEKNFGFSYKKNFRKMMISTIGIISAENLENELISSGDFLILDSTLNNLINERNNAAHTTTAGAMITYQAPSVTKQQLENLYPIVRRMYSFAVKYHKNN